MLRIYDKNARERPKIVSHILLWLSCSGFPLYSSPTFLSFVNHDWLTVKTAFEMTLDCVGFTPTQLRHEAVLIRLM